MMVVSQAAASAAASGGSCSSAMMKSGFHVLSRHGPWNRQGGGKLVGGCYHHHHHHHSHSLSIRRMGRSSRSSSSSSSSNNNNNNKKGIRSKKIHGASDPHRDVFDYCSTPSSRVKVAMTTRLPPFSATENTAPMGNSRRFFHKTSSTRNNGVKGGKSALGNHGNGEIDSAGAMCVTIKRWRESNKDLSTLDQKTEKWLNEDWMSVTKWEMSRANQGRSLIESWVRSSPLSRYAVERASQMMREWIGEVEKGWSPAANQPFALELLHQVLYAWQTLSCQAEDELGADELWSQPVRLLEGMEMASDAAGVASLRPSDKAYSMVLGVLANVPPVVVISNADLDARVHARTFSAAEYRCVLAVQLLHRRLRSSHGEGDVTLWGACLNVLAKCSPHHDGAVERAEMLLADLESSDHPYTPVPNAYCYSHVIHAWARHRGRRRSEAAPRAQALLEHMLELHRQGHLPPVETVVFNTVIDAWAQRGSPQGAEAAEALFHRMLERSPPGSGQASAATDVSASSSAMEPDAVTVASVINAWARSHHPDAALRAERLLRKARDELHIPIPAEVYTATIRCWGQVAAASTDESTGVDAIHDPGTTSATAAAQRAEALLDEMERGVISHTSSAVGPSSPAVSGGATPTPPGPTTITYTTVIHALAHSRDRNAGHRAERILQRMEELSHSGVRDVALNTIAFTAAITTWAKSGLPGAGIRARALLRRMERMTEEGNQAVAPNMITYNAVMAAFANEGDFESASEMLRETEEAGSKSRWPRRSPKIRPDVISYTTVLDALAKSGYPNAGDEVMNILDRMDAAEVQPNAAAYTAAITCFAASGTTANALADGEVGVEEEAESILWRMQSEADTGLLSSRPNAWTLVAVLRVWDRSRRADAPERAKQILAWAERKYQSGENPDLRLNRLCLNYMLSIWGNSRRGEEAVEEAESILRFMVKQPRGDQLEPNATSYNGLLSALTYDSRPKALMKCYQTVQLMIARYGEGVKLVRPNRRTFHLLLNALSVHSSALGTAGTKNSNPDNRNTKAGDGFLAQQILTFVAQQIVPSQKGLLSSSTASSSSSSTEASSSNMGGQKKDRSDTNLPLLQPNSVSFLLFFRAAAVVGVRNEAFLRVVLTHARETDNVNIQVFEAFKHATSRARTAAAAAAAESSMGDFHGGPSSATSGGRIMAF